MTDLSLCLETLAIIVPQSHSMSPAGGSSNDFQQISPPRSDSGSELRDGWLTHWPWQVPRGIEECAGTFWNVQRSCFQPHVKVMLHSEPVRRTACNVCLHDSVTSKPHHNSPVSPSFAILTLCPFVRRAEASQHHKGSSYSSGAQNMCAFISTKIGMMEWQRERERWKVQMRPCAGPRSD